MTREITKSTLLLTTIFVVMSVNTCLAQTGMSNWRKVIITSDTTIFTALPIIPGSVEFGNQFDPDQLIVNQNSITVRSLDKPAYLTFRVFQDVWTEESPPLDRYTSAFSREKNDRIKKGSYQLIDKENLLYQGSFSRGVQVGNSQSLLLNSNFNMQMSGLIGDDVHVKGAISDNTIPIQPEGNTRNLQEFDKIFIQISKKQHTLLAGDYNLERPEGYFINYFKKVSGIQYQYVDSIGPNWKAEAKTGYAAARGKFARNTIAPKEGNQGPYQLSGNEGERFLVILAGTERVFWDGELLQRGADNDYVIDYNQGQLHFTYKRLVQSNARIIVEFEYIERNYGRSALTANTRFSSEKGSFYLNAYQHTDSKSPSDDFSLDSLSLASLRAAGDRTDQAVISGARNAEEGEFENRILYIQKDTNYISNGKRVDTTIFEYVEQPNETEALVVKFSQVNQGEGDYILDKSDVNGRVYQWVSPDEIDGKRKGNYRPEIQIGAPEQLRMLSLGGEWRPSQAWKIEMEGIVSQRDKNRLSNLDDANNEGLGGMAKIAFKQPISKNIALKAHTRHELINEKLEVVAPFRPAEFTRDWNTVLADKQNEWLQEYGLALWNNPQNHLSWNVTEYQRASGYNGNKNNLSGIFSNNGWKINSKSSILNASNDDEKITFIRPQLLLQKTITKLKKASIGVNYLQEKNEIKKKGVLTNQSFQFEELSAWINGPKKQNWSGRAQWKQRTDQREDLSELELVSRATDISGEIGYKGSLPLTFNIVTQWRQFESERPDIIGVNDQNSLLIRLDERLSLWSRAVEINSSYEVSSGQEPLLEFVFEERRPGEGSYIYQDLNNDGIKQINEYIPAPFVDTARYVRIQLLNTAFATTQNLLFNQNLKLIPKNFWSKEAPIWAQKIEWTSVIKTQAKTRGNLKYNPYKNVVSDSLLMASSAIFNHQLYINKGGAKFDLQIGQRIFQTLQNQISGREERRSSEWWMRSRINLWKTSELILSSSITSREDDSQFFQERRNKISGWNSFLEWNTVIHRIYRITGSYGHTQKENQLEFGGESISQNQIGINFQYRKAQAFNVRTSLVLHWVDFKDQGNQVVNFILLEGKRKGRNYQWGIDFDKILFRNVRLNLGYKGRKNGNGRVLHSGQANFTAQF